MTSSARATKMESTGSAALWFGLLAGPFAWLTQLVVGMELPEFMCSPGAANTSVYGVGLEIVIQVVTLVVAAVTILAGLVSLRCWRRTRNGNGTTRERAAWMGLAGVITNCLFLILILPGFLPAGFLTECGRSL